MTNDKAPIISVNLKKINYSIPLRSKYTFITGDSGNGKSTFISAIEQDLHTITSGYFTVLIPKGERQGYLTLDDCMHQEKAILVADEDYNYMHYKSFQSLMSKTKGLFVLVERYPFPSLSYASTDIVHFDNSKNHNLLPTYLYDIDSVKWEHVKNVIIEDSGSGLSFFKTIFQNTKTSCGKDNIRKLITSERNTLFIADALGIGSSIQAINSALIESSDRCNQLLLVDSFEALVLKSKFMNMWEHPPINCSNKEEYATQLLISIVSQNGTNY